MAVKWHQAMLELSALIKANKWEDDFNRATDAARKSRVPELADIRNLDDYLIWLNNLLHWVPTEQSDGRAVGNALCKAYFILDQPPVLALQNRITPHGTAPPLTPLSAWMVTYANAIGAF